MSQIAVAFPKETNLSCVTFNGVNVVALGTRVAHSLLSGHIAPRVVKDIQEQR